MEHDYKNGIYIYHLTSMKNMKSIFTIGLLPRKKLGPIKWQDVADPDIISYREKNNLTGYVPFHFFAETPFAYRVRQRYPQDSFVYILIKRSSIKNKGFAIIPQHPLSSAMQMFPKIYNYLDGIEKINWDLMNKRDYKDNACKMVCMAECIYPGTIPIASLAQETSDIAFLTRSETDKTELQQIYTSVHPQSKRSLYILSDKKKSSS